MASNTQNPTGEAPAPEHSAEDVPAPLAFVVATRYLQENPEDIPYVVPEWLDTLVTPQAGAVVIRDGLPERGIEALPDELSIAIARTCHVAIIIMQEQRLPEFDQYDADETFCWKNAQAARQRVKTAYVFCAPGQTARWQAFFEHHNPGAWIGVIDGHGGRIWREGKRTPPQGPASPPVKN